MVKVGIAGVTGYTGEELLALLLKHPQVRIAGVFSRSAHGKNIADVFPRFKNRIDMVCQKLDAQSIKKCCDVVFLALPHTASMDLVPQLVGAGRKVIDLSADYRLKDAKVYAAYYETKHKDAAGLATAVYGLPELARNKIKNALLVANPGCYPTAVILGLAPLVSFGIASLDSIVIDAKSGVSGVGKKMAEGFMFCEANEDFKAYKVGTHQHTPEINQELSVLASRKVAVTFVPHLLPLNRGILATMYVKKTRIKMQAKNLQDLYKKFYKKEPFIRVKDAGVFPRIKEVAGTNFCDIGIKDSGDSIIVISAIDNLLKGASGQAVQNLNIICGFAEGTALI